MFSSVSPGIGEPDVASFGEVLNPIPSLRLIPILSHFRGVLSPSCALSSLCASPLSPYLASPSSSSRLRGFWGDDI